MKIHACTLRTLIPLLGVLKPFICSWHAHQKSQRNQIQTEHKSAIHKKSRKLSLKAFGLTYAGVDRDQVMEKVYDGEDESDEYDGPDEYEEYDPELDRDEEEE